MLNDTDWRTINENPQSGNINNVLQMNTIKNTIIVMKIKWKLEVQSCARYFEIFVIFSDVLSRKLFGNSWGYRYMFITLESASAVLVVNRICTKTRKHFKILPTWLSEFFLFCYLLFFKWFEFLNVTLYWLQIEHSIKRFATNENCCKLNFLTKTKHAKWCLHNTV